MTHSTVTALLLEAPSADPLADPLAAQVLLVVAAITAAPLGVGVVGGVDEEVDVVEGVAVATPLRDGVVKPVTSI